MITVQDILKNANAYIGDSSEDRITNGDRYQAATEATAWLLEELGNEHMVDRANIEYIPTVTWYKMNNLTPYLLTAGQLRLKNEEPNRIDFTRVEARDLATMPENRYAYAIERYNDAAYLGIKIPPTRDSKQDEGCSMDLIQLSSSDNNIYTGINAVNITKESDAVRFDMQNTGLTSSGISTTSKTVNLTDYSSNGILIFEVEIPDMDDVTSVSVKFGTNLVTDYYTGTVTTDLNNNPLVVGVNTIGIRLSEVTVVGSPDMANISAWSWQVNHLGTKPLAEGFKFSDMRVAKPVSLTFKYIFYRVGKDSTGTDITEFTSLGDVPFFAERYPQYRYCVAHKTASVLFRNQRLIDESRLEEREAVKSLERYRKNFSGERSMASSQFKIAGVRLRNRIVTRRK